MLTSSLKRRYSLLMAFLLLTITLIGCNWQADNEEQSFLETADENLAVNYDEVITESKENTADGPYGDTSDEYAGETITQLIEGADGRKISIDAQVYTEGIDQVSCYKYVPESFTEEMRNALLKEMHPAETWDVIEAAIYSPEKDAWEFVTPIGGSWIYQITHSELPKEDILNHENINANISSDIKQIFPVTDRDYDGIAVEDEMLMEMINTIPVELETLGLLDISSIDKDSEYVCSFIHICEAQDGQVYAKAVFKKMLDGIPVTAWHDFSTATGKESPFPAKIWGSLFSEEKLGLDHPILSASEAVAVMQEQIDQIPIQEEPLVITKISLEYLTVISSDGDLLIVPVWRFWAGEDEKERSLRSEEVIAVNAINGELIWEKRESFVE
ncbi:MAG: hypothetical protein K2J95_01100 [Lachnospiraceae bacterium]|nr:hypothetical protein [Lachnospiraceae bacterium]